MSETTRVNQRTIRYVVRPVEVLEGGGTPVQRVLPSHGVPYIHIDPFLLLDDFQTSGGGEGFPSHSHRGFEIITYLLEGTVQHTDSEGNTEMLNAGGLQKITAGRGITHGEGPGGRTGQRIRGLQLWINLAKTDKGIEPHYQLLEPEQIPTQNHDGITIRTLAGEGTHIVLHTPARYLDVSLSPGKEFEESMPTDFNGFAYLITGGGVFGQDATSAVQGQLLILGPGEEFTARNTGREPLRFVLGAGQPHKEPVQWRGPFVD